MITRTCIKSRKLFLFRFRRWKILKRQNYAKNGLPKFATRHSAQTGKYLIQSIERIRNITQRKIKRWDI